MNFFDRFKDDVVFLNGALRALKNTTPIAKNPTRVFPLLIQELAEQHFDKPALVCDRERLSYAGLAERANRYSRWALNHGLAKGEVVALLMPNRPEYLAIWIGITAVGGVVSLLNTNLAGPSLAHCIDVVDAKHVIVAAELSPAFATAEPHLQKRAQIWVHGESTAPLPRIDREVEPLPVDPLTAEERRPLTIEDRALFIYTSGTTGMPKAANINHYRLLLAAFGFAGVMDTQPTDRMYDCLPMYHTSGGVVATGAVLVNGGTVVIREKFSAREFWDDIVRHECTIFQYIGELCRYLINTPPQPNETAHHLRLACGNGLRIDIWNEFKERFRIPHILEFYGATEGNVNMFNFEGRPGAVGRLPWFLERRFPVRVVKFDVEKEVPVRDAQGFCIRCEPDEVGETIGQILNDASKPGNRFEGYADSKDNERKILRNVFKEGDAWFRTGDLMRQDNDGYFYFVDRIGDTFRWKGENVSTTEVAEAIDRFPGVRDANVYGVPIPGHDGRAGMAAIVCEGGVDFAALREHLAKCLPAYARPLFLRIRGELEMTATFKQKKLDLVAQGFDPKRTSDAIFFDDPRAHAFVRLDAGLNAQIVGGKIKL